MAKTETKWLTREQIDEVIAGMSARDLIDASAGDISNGERAGMAFDSAAKRLGLSNGTPATASVKASDFLYLGQMMNEVMGNDSPKSQGGEDSPDSAATGG